MRRRFFSIIVVSLNPGERLEKTLNSIASQTFTDYEVIVKDGGSKDGSLKKLTEQGFFEKHPQFRVIKQADKGIYDAMNQAVRLVYGNYVLFLNCGDLFYDEKVLERVADQIVEKSQFQEEKATGETAQQAGKIDREVTKHAVKAGCLEEAWPNKIRIYYGSQYNQQQGSIVYSAPQINDFTCYRNVPCHQVCFYDARLFWKRGYDLKYKVRADYEHFLYSIYEEKAEGVSMPVIVASYEGGGFSETKENRKMSAREHQEITMRYLGAKKVWKYRVIMWLTLAPLRTKIAQSPVLSGAYNGVKNGVYRLMRRS